MSAPLSDHPLESRAFAFFLERQANVARRDRGAADRMQFAGVEREFCLRAVRGHIEQEAYEMQKAADEIAYWSGISNPALRAMADALERDRAQPNYTIAVHSAIRDRDAAELRRLKAEIVRRDMNAGADAICAALMAPYLLEAAE